jgi:hypothetical protein
MHTHNLRVLILCVVLQSLCINAELRIAILMQGSDFINVSVVPVFQVNQYDLGDVYISPCRDGTYNEARDSYCKDCAICSRNQYQALECTSIQNRLCVNCTLCTDMDQEICACGQRSGDCGTGNRVCMPLPATSINITFHLNVGSPLSSLKERFLQEGLRTGFVLYLSSFLAHSSDEIFLLSLNKMESGKTYIATFAVNEVYSLFTKTQVTYITQDVIQTGLTNTFGIQSNTFNTLISGKRRRLLQQNTLVDLYAYDVAAQCISQGECGRFFVMLYPEDPCRSECAALPCPQGYTGFFGLCEECPNATYKSTVGNESCSPCPVMHRSDQGSVDISQCIPSLITTAPSTSSTISPTSSIGMSTTVSVQPEARIPSSTSSFFLPSTSELNSNSGQVLLSSTGSPLQSTTSVPTSIGISTFFSGLPSTTDTLTERFSTTGKPETHQKSSLSTSSSSMADPSVTLPFVPPPPPAFWPSQPYYYLYPGNSNQTFFMSMGQSGATQTVIVNNEGKDTSVILWISMAMMAFLLILLCIGARLFLFPVRQNYYYYYYTKVKDDREIPIPIRRPDAPQSPFGPNPAPQPPFRQIPGPSTPFRPNPEGQPPFRPNPVPQPPFRQIPDPLAPVRPKPEPSPRAPWTPWIPTPWAPTPDIYRYPCPPAFPPVPEPIPESVPTLPPPPNIPSIPMPSTPEIRPVPRVPVTPSTPVPPTPRIPQRQPSIPLVPLVPPKPGPCAEVPAKKVVHQPAPGDIVFKGPVKYLDVNHLHSN